MRFVLIIFSFCLSLNILSKVIDSGIIDAEKGIVFLQYENGAKYTGTINKKGCHGYGELRWNNGDIYEGDWIDNKRTGKGKLTWNNGDIYEGDWIDDKRTGKGKLTWNNGNIYEGDWIDGKRTGKGKFTWSDGNFYVGEYKNNERYGQGNYSTSNGYQYIGEFVKNKKNGFGIEISNKKNLKSKYAGYFKNGRKHGDGKVTVEFSSGEIRNFEGIWNEDYFTFGKSITFIKSDNKEYKIELEGKFYGYVFLEGKVTSFDGDRVTVTEGKYNKGLELNGYGSIKSSTSIMEGNFINNKPEGYIISTDLNDGAKSISFYKDGIEVEGSHKWLELPDNLKRKKEEIERMRIANENELREYKSRNNNVNSLMDFSSFLLKTGKYANKPQKNNRGFLMKTCFLDGSSIHQSQIQFHCM